MENCEKHSKKICAYCKHYDYCARVNRCDGRCYDCDNTECENNTNYKEQLTNKIQIIIGSWGSYSACNSRALGSSPIDLSAYSCWEQIEESLRKQGFDLDGIDEELFVQDIDGLPNGYADWDYIHPKKLFETLNKSGVLESEHLYTVLCAFLEVRSFEEFADRVERLGDNWDDEVYLYEGYDWEDYGKELFEICERRLDDDLIDYFDFEAYGRANGLDCAQEYSKGIIEITGG